MLIKEDLVGWDIVKLNSRKSPSEAILHMDRLTLTHAGRDSHSTPATRGKDISRIPGWVGEGEQQRKTERHTKK